MHENYKKMAGQDPMTWGTDRAKPEI